MDCRHGEVTHGEVSRHGRRGCPDGLHPAASPCSGSHHLIDIDAHPQSQVSPLTLGRNQGCRQGRYPCREARRWAHPARPFPPPAKPSRWGARPPVCPGAHHRAAPPWTHRGSGGASVGRTAGLAAPWSAPAMQTHRLVAQQSAGCATPMNTGVGGGGGRRTGVGGTGGPRLTPCPLGRQAGRSDDCSGVWWQPRDGRRLNSAGATTHNLSR